MADNWVIFGSSTGGPDRFRIASFDSASGALSAPRDDASAIAPSYFILSPDNTRLYACLSGEGFGPGEGGVAAYEVDAAAGTLRFINSLPSGGIEPCHVSLDRDGKHVLVANYSSGSVAVFSLRPDGGLDERTAHWGFDSKGSVDPSRQDKPYAHSIVTDPSGRYALVADLGSDRIWVFSYDAATGTFTSEPRETALQPGDGPRHLAFHPDGRTLFVSNELSNTVASFSWDPGTGTLTAVGHASTLPEGETATCYVAEILVSPDGHTLYVSNRYVEGPDSIAVFAIRNGRLERQQIIATEGSFPRNMALDPAGRWLIITNHKGGNGIVLAVDARDGRLSRTTQPFTLPEGFGVRFVPRV